MKTVFLQTKKVGFGPLHDKNDLTLKAHVPTEAKASRVCNYFSGL